MGSAQREHNMSEVLLRILLRKIQKEYVSKDIIRDKIKQLQQEKGSINTSNYDFHEAIEEIYNNKIEILKELLAENEL